MNLHNNTVCHFPWNESIQARIFNDYYNNWVIDCRRQYTCVLPEHCSSASMIVCIFMWQGNKVRKNIVEVWSQLWPKIHKPTSLSSIKKLCLFWGEGWEIKGMDSTLLLMPYWESKISCSVQVIHNSMGNSLMSVAHASQGYLIDFTGVISPLWKL
jgi:hypothetical protein